MQKIRVQLCQLCRLEADGPCVCVFSPAKGEREIWERSGFDKCELHFGAVVISHWLSTRSLTSLALARPSK